MHEVARQPSERQSLYIGLYNEPEKNEGFLYRKSKQPPDDALALKTKSKTSYTMRSGNHPSRSDKGSTTEMFIRSCVPQAGLPWERPCFYFLTANNPATIGQGATAAACGGKSRLKHGEN